MKKTYIAPEIEVVEIQAACSMLQASKFELKSGSGRVSGSSALSRENIGGWDEDEDFDY